jgi:hypothetical protein
MTDWRSNVEKKGGTFSSDFDTLFFTSAKTEAFKLSLRLFSAIGLIYHDNEMSPLQSSS